MGKSFLRPREYAEMWRVHINTVYHWLRLGLLPGARAVKCCQRRLHYIPIGVVPPRLYPGPCPGRRRTELPEDIPPWDPSHDPSYHPADHQKTIDFQRQLIENQITINQISDEDWEMIASETQAIQAGIGSEVR